MVVVKSTEKSATPSIPEEETPVSPKKSPITPISVVLTIFLVLGIGVMVFFNQLMELPLVRKYLLRQRTGSQLATTESMSRPTPTPTPIVLKPDEGTKGNYTISRGGKSPGPEISRVTFDPLDVQKDQNLTVTVTVTSESTPNSLTGKLISDFKTTSLTFKNTSKSSKSSVWTATIRLTDTVLYKYILELIATDKSGKTQVTVAPRS